jgi:hypothetical protein
MDLTVLKYHIQLRDHLKAQGKTWEWFESAKVREEQLKEFKSNLLKNTYRLDKDENPALYDKVNFAKEKLGLQTEVTLYQAQNSADLNAGISCLPGEAHIVLSGQIVKLMNDDELLSILAHELSHARLFTIDKGEFEVSDRIITSIANDSRSNDVYVETARLFRLYMELYCDRGSLLVVGNIETVLSSLIKVNTGLDKVSVQSYMKQAEEIFAAEKVQSEYDTHPENYIRVKALKAWEENKEGAEREITRMIEGETRMNSLDIFGQYNLRDLSFQLIKLLVKPKWMQSTAVMSLCRQYKSDFTPDPKIVITDAMAATFSELSVTVKEYLSFILIDFSLVDPTLEEVPMGFAFQLAEDLGLKEAFNKSIKSELKLGDRKLSETHKKCAQALSEMKESNEEHIYEN